MFYLSSAEVKSIKNMARKALKAIRLNRLIITHEISLKFWHKYCEN